MFCHMEGQVVSPNSSLLDEFSPSLEINMEDILNCQDPPGFDWISTKDLDRGYAKVELAASMPPSIPKVDAHASNESTVRDYCRFAQVVLSLPPTEGFDADFDPGIEQGDSGQSDRPCTWFVLYADNALWHQLILTEVLEPDLLRWYLQVKKFDFVVRDKNDAHTLTDTNEA